MKNVSVISETIFSRYKAVHIASSDEKGLLNELVANEAPGWELKNTYYIAVHCRELSL